jgi:hypothetical protein
MKLKTVPNSCSQYPFLPNERRMSKVILKLKSIFTPGITIPTMYHLGRPTIFTQYHQLRIGTQAKMGFSPAALNILDKPNRVSENAMIHKMRNRSELKLSINYISFQS